MNKDSWKIIVCAICGEVTASYGVVNMPMYQTECME
jgi:hypothetical protein